MATQTIRPIRIEGNVAYVPLTRGYEAVIDASDAPIAEGFNWHVMVGSHATYAQRTVHKNGRQTTIRLHRAIMGAPPGILEVDHANGNGLDNRRANLRLATHLENLRNKRRQANNSSGYKGVSWFKRDRRWRARIKANGKVICLGYFTTPEAAHEAYNKAAQTHYGEFARVS